MTSTSTERRFEPFVHLLDVTDRSVLVGWGGFYLDCDDGGGCQVVDDEALEDPERRRSGTIGVQSASYGPAVVEVLDDGGGVVATGEAADRNSAWVQGLEPDTAYRYRVVVDGEPWAEGPRWDWAPDAGDGNWDRSYDLRFRTHPPEGTAVPVTFVALGDYGVGICEREAGRRQQQVARTLEWLAANRPVRLVVSLGDNIYHGPEGKGKRTGDEDDDWYFTFYEPYRYLIDHLPVYATVGNHDTGDTEASDDRAQLADNFHLETRFRSRVEEGRASLDRGIPGRWDEVGTLAWAQEAHCLLVEVDADRVVVTPYGVARPGGEPEPLTLRTPGGEPVEGPLVFPRHWRFGALPGMRSGPSAGTLRP